MKITGLRALTLEPRRNPHQEVPEYMDEPMRQNGLAIISTDEGIEGVVSSQAANVRNLARLWHEAREHIEGQDPFDRGKIDTVLRRRFNGPWRALGVLDYGLWDIAGKALNKPIYKLLGATRDKILAYGSTIHHDTDEKFVETTLAAKSRGLTAVKLHPYCNFEDDLRLVYKVRKAVGDDFRLMIDCLRYPAPYTRQQALRMGQALDELNFWWFEDPLAKTDLEGYAELTRECKVVQVRAHDRVERIGEYAAMIKNRCMDIMAGPGSIGITELMKLAGLAEANNMNMEPHDFGGGTASLHVGLAINNADFYEQAIPDGCFDTGLYPGVYLEPVRIDPEGYAHGPKSPGLGFAIDVKEAEKVASEIWDSRQHA